jgi:hypothetical protein
MSRPLLHFGGNGHCSSRLDLARLALARRCDRLELVDVPYPGFEGRPGPASFEEFLDDISGFVRGLQIAPVGGYASGIGALIALGLRARGTLIGVPLIFQGPVLWGLKRRWFPRAMRAFPTARGLLQSAFGWSRFQSRFARKQFMKTHDPMFLAAFFDGYRRCSIFGEFFDWFTPEWLGSLEREFAKNPEGLEGITAWVGGTLWSGLTKSG